jgi:hypothetical protein
VDIICTKLTNYEVKLSTDGEDEDIDGRTIDMQDKTNENDHSSNDPQDFCWCDANPAENIPSPH